jgi:hypothetical protein
VDSDELSAKRSSSGRTSSLENLADPGVRRLLNHVKQLVAFDGHIEVWVDGLSLANAFSHPQVQLGNVERKPSGTAGRTQRQLSGIERSAGGLLAEPQSSSLRELRGDENLR